MQKCYLAMELPHPVIIGILIFFKTFNLGSFENYIYIMQEAKKSMSSLNVVFFFTHFTSDHLYLILWANIV